tara:strand:- start:46 stop:219 length:174 start_codon:yes stop_codon:yes gene_type:complete
MSKMNCEDDGSVKPARFEAYLNKIGIRDAVGCCKYYQSIASEDKGKTISLGMIGMDV